MRSIALSMRVAALAGAVAIAATACGGGGKINTSTPTTTKSTDPTTTVDPAAAQRAAVIDGYQQFWVAYKQALAAANPDDPILAAHLTGAELSHLRVELTGMRDAPTPEVMRVSDDIHPKVVALEATRAVIQDCFSETDTYFTRDGKPSGTPDSFKVGAEFELLLEGGTWKVSTKTHKDSACPG
jgi:hypothetical protein